LKLTVHPTRKGASEGAWYGDICASGNTAYLIMGENSLLRLAEIVGDKALAARRKARIEKAVAAMRKQMWDEEAGTFLSVKRDSLGKVPVATIRSWIALMAGVPTATMAKRMAEVLQTEHWTTPLPVPTVDRKDSRWKSDSYWRGDVWPAPNYQIATGMARYGYKDLAADLADKTVANALKHGVSEHYDAVSGKPLGVTFLGMSCTIATLMLDGLCGKYSVRVKSTGGG
jgi:putative isomerase